MTDPRPMVRACCWCEVLDGRGTDPDVIPIYIGWTWGDALARRAQVLTERHPHIPPVDTPAEAEDETERDLARFSPVEILAPSAEVLYGILRTMGVLNPESELGPIRA